MDKEGQPIQFSSDKISEKKKPDFFIASNEKAARRERSSIGAFFAKIGGFFKRLGARILDYIKHPFRGKHKILTILLFIVIVAVVVIIVLNLTIWQKTTKDTTPLSEEEILAWDQELSEINREAYDLSDDEMKKYYTNYIEKEKNEYKYYDFVLEYANALTRRGFVDDAVKILESVSTESLSCIQAISYYAEYSAAYSMFYGSDDNSQSQYYSDLAERQMYICQTGEEPPIEESDTISDDGQSLEEDTSNE